MIDALGEELRRLLGPAAVVDDEAGLSRASVDGAAMSPVLAARLPLGRADLVAIPADAAGIARAVAVAVCHRVPVTVRGKGTGNYGQGIPMAGGLVVDTSRARAVVDIGPGYVVAEAGATFLAVEQAANRTGQQLLIYPSTVQSTIGGFVSGGSGGTGSIRNGLLHHGSYVRALDVVHGTGDDHLVSVTGDEAQGYVHTYGTTGVVARVTLALEPLQEWRALYASFDDLPALLPLLRAFAELEPTPRLVSADPALLAGALPPDPALPRGRASLRAILDAATVARARSLVEAAGGTVEAVRAGPRETMRLSTLSYNHPVEWLQRACPGVYAHVEVSGDALVERHADVLTVYPEGALHLEAQRGRPIGMLVGRYTGEEALYAGFDRLTALGVAYHNCHQWYVDHEPERTAALAAVTDPHGLFNPGKLAVASARLTGTQL